jgi:hypothetical protein
LLEYVLRKAVLPGTGGSVKPLVSFPYGDVIECIARDICPLEEPEDIVSSESVPCSIELEIEGRRGEIVSPGANNPFLVAGEDFEPIENRALALGAEATRLMNREAVAPIDLGLNVPFVRDLGKVGVVVVAGYNACGVFPSCGLILDKFVNGRVFSDFVCCRDRKEVSVYLGEE